ncbi:actin-7-related [Anaeramoeba flamelloides]|uniref:Actin-7-related n=1 Tax=Anaeramoeba flamelloides TaxID=1746091 RepID=A0ABQ8X5Y3_9EUKA|nr:actin-7-related [Anaeramoeba flamelloides]
MNKKPVVIDFGSRFVKTKTQGNDDPILIPSFVGFQRFHHMTFVEEKDGAYYGSKGRNVEQKEKLCEMLLETFQAPSLIYSLSSPYNLYQGSEKTNNLTGISIEMGHSVTEIVPIIDGVPKFETTKNKNTQNNNLYNFGGKNVNERLTKSINKSFFDFQFQTSNDLQIIERFKETNCFFNLNDLNILQDLRKEIMFAFPNEQTRTIENNNILWECCEPYFKSNLLPNNNNNKNKNKNKQNLPEKIISIIKPFNFEQRNLLLQNIILSGGSSLIRNCDKRLEYELNELLIKLVEEEQGQKENENRILPNLKCKINNHHKENPKFQQCLSLVNASSLLESQDSNFIKQFIQKEEWDEIGVNILKKKNNISFQNCIKGNKGQGQEQEEEEEEEQEEQEEEEYFSNYMHSKETINYSYMKISKSQKTAENSSSEPNQGLMLDLGSSMIQAGFCGDDAPRAVFPTIIGRPKYIGVMVGMGQRDKYVGDEAQAKRAILKLNKPIQRGVPVHWEDYERLLHHTYYNELRVAPEEHPNYFSIHPRFPKKELGKMYEIFFETFNTPSCMFSLDNYLNLVSTGQKTGLMVSIGSDVTSIAPFVNFNLIESGIRKVNFGGRDVTNYLNKLISMSQYQATTASEFEIINDIKEKACFVSLNYLDDLQYSQTTTNLEFTYENIDRNMIDLNKERFQATELLFQPSLDNLQIKPIHKLIVESIMSCPIDFQKELFKNIYIFGGSTMFRNFIKRLEAEIKKIVPKGIKTQVNAPIERKFSTWIGGSGLGDMLETKNLTSWALSNPDYNNDPEKKFLEQYYFKSSNNIFHSFDYNIEKNCRLSNFHKQNLFLKKDFDLLNVFKKKEHQQYREKLNFQKNVNSINEKSIKLNSVINDLTEKNKEYLLQVKKLKEEIRLNK